MPTPNSTPPLEPFVDRLEAGLEDLRSRVQDLERFARAQAQVLRDRSEGLAHEAQQRTTAQLRETRVTAERLRDALRDRAENAWEESPLRERWTNLHSEATNAVSEGLKRAVDALPIASQRDVEKVNRKVATLQRKVRKMEKADAS